jgi:hypothetical protein
VKTSNRGHALSFTLDVTGAQGEGTRDRRRQVRHLHGRWRHV